MRKPTRPRAADPGRSGLPQKAPSPSTPAPKPTLTPKPPLVGSGAPQSGARGMTPVPGAGPPAPRARVPGGHDLGHRRVVSTGLAARIAERDSQHRRRRRRQLGLVLGTGVALLFIGWLGFFSSLFALDPTHTRVRGDNAIVPADDVRRIVSEAEGVPLTRLDTVGLRTRLLALTGVADASIHRAWPDGLVVRVKPRVAVAAIPIESSFAIVDAQAVRLAEQPSEPTDLPVIAIPWDGQSDASRPLQAALVLLGALPADLRSEVATVSAATQDNVEMVLRDGVRVLWGGSNDAALKVDVLVTMRGLPEATGVTEYDLSTPRTPITR